MQGGMRRAGKARDGLHHWPSLDRLQESHGFQPRRHGIPIHLVQARDFEQENLFLFDGCPIPVNPLKLRKSKEGTISLSYCMQSKNKPGRLAFQVIPIQIGQLWFIPHKSPHELWKIPLEFWRFLLYETKLLGIFRIL